MSSAGVLIRAAAVARPRYAHVVHIWRHFAVLTVFRLPGQNRDHLFLVREGWLLTEIWKFKVMTLGPFF